MNIFEVPNGSGSLQLMIHATRVEWSLAPGFIVVRKIVFITMLRARVNVLSPNINTMFALTAIQVLVTPSSICNRYTLTTCGKYQHRQGKTCEISTLYPKATRENRQGRRLSGLKQEITNNLSCCTGMGRKVALPYENVHTRI